jgi:hypothetical protein
MLESAVPFDAATQPNLAGLSRTSGKAHENVVKDNYTTFLSR